MNCFFRKTYTKIYHSLHVSYFMRKNISTILSTGLLAGAVFYCGYALRSYQSHEFENHIDKRLRKVELMTAYLYDAHMSEHYSSSTWNLFLEQNSSKPSESLEKLREYFFDVKKQISDAIKGNNEMKKED